MKRSEYNKQKSLFHPLLPTERGRAAAEKMDHFSLDFHGFWLESSGEGMARPGLTVLSVSHIRAPRQRASAPHNLS
eukprot:5170265-Prymnesium_polylepis.1